MKKFIIAMLLVAWIPSQAYSQKPQDTKDEDVTILGGFIKGKDYLDLKPDEKRFYAIGFMDGILVARLFGAPAEKMEPLNACVTNMTSSQVVAILTKYLQDNPGKWHQPMNGLSFNAIHDACSSPPKK